VTLPITLTDPKQSSPKSPYFHILDLLLIPGTAEASHPILYTSKLHQFITLLLVGVWSTVIIECLCTLLDISKITRPNFSKFYVHNIHGCGSILWQQCSMSRMTSSFVNDVTCTHAWQKYTITVWHKLLVQCWGMAWQYVKKVVPVTWLCAIIACKQHAHETTYKITVQLLHKNCMQ